LKQLPVSSRAQTVARESPDSPRNKAGGGRRID
jgi:hypothetical protein